MGDARNHTRPSGTRYSAPHFLMVCPYRVAIVGISALAGLIALWFYNRCEDEEEDMGVTKAATAAAEEEDTKGSTGWSVGNLLFYTLVAVAHVLLLTSLGPKLLDLCGLEWLSAWLQAWWTQFYSDLLE